MGIEPVVSIWPTINPQSRNWKAMSEGNMLVRTESGQYGIFDFYGQQTYVDMTSPQARDYLWEQVKKGVSLSRAYGGYEEKRRKAEDAARKRNEENAALSSGRISGVTKKAVYTAQDVAAMSAAEVRGNYDDILASMDSEGFYI